MRQARISAVLACFLAGACTPQVAAQPPSTPSSSSRIEAATDALTGMTCGELLPVLRAKDKRGGLIILWLDDYYARHSGLPPWDSDWAKTVSQAVGGTCAITVNAPRTVLDVIAQMRRDYGGPKS